MSLQLTHYTRETTTVLNILSNGFAWVPNCRNLISYLIPDHDFSEREPQQFGMISFTELTPGEAVEHRKEFGNYGITVSENWTRKHRVQKVLYIDKSGGPIFDALSLIFKEGYNDVRSKIRFPDDAMWQMAYTNKAAAAITNSRLWIGLLQLYEYIEPIENAYQSEWRIIHPEPYYGYANTKAKIIKNVSPPQGWAKVLNVVTVQPEDVIGFVCPRGNQESLKSVLPKVYKTKPVVIVEV
ncbi:conserved hypothetical protein [Candidatus Brocadia pituitae]|nr:conserved hypothetical protein [Candidatus Brocadia pituitae]